MGDDLEDYKLETTFEREAGCVLHTSWMQDRARGLRKVRVKDRWHLKREIGVGSFGTVYLEATEDGRERAVKAVRKRLAEKFKVDHRRELSALTVLSRSKYLQHQTFVEFLGWFEDDDFIFLAMEYVPHGDLGMYNGEIKEDDAQIISQQLLKGLQIMHKKGFTHRDLKPQNIFVVQTTPSWWVKIGDFGISKRIKAGDATELRTQAGAIGYEAPEIRGLIADAASQESSVYSNTVDIWSFGCVIYKIMTKEVPFQNSGDLRGYCDGRISFPSARLEEIPEEVVFKASEMRFSLPQADSDPPKPIEVIKFKDSVGRKFSFPFVACRTWTGMEDLTRQAFLHVDVIGPHVIDGHYDLVGPNGDIILPQVWEMMIRPDWAITMHMWPLPEPPELPPRRSDRPLMPPGWIPPARNSMPGIIIIDEEAPTRKSKDRKKEAIGGVLGVFGRR